MRHSTRKWSAKSFNAWRAANGSPAIGFRRRPSLPSALASPSSPSGPAFKSWSSSGILRRHQGKGTFVALHRSRPLRYQFLRIYNNDGDRVRWDRELISVKKKRADDETARLLRLKGSAAERAVFDVLFLLKNEGKALAFVESKMPAKIFGVMPEAVLRNTTDNFYAVFQERFGVNVIQTQERVWAVHAGSRGARWLGVRSSEPMLRIERIAYTYNDVPVELRYYNVRADRYCYFAPPQ